MTMPNRMGKGRETTTLHKELWVIEENWELERCFFSGNSRLVCCPVPNGQPRDSIYVTLYRLNRSYLGIYMNAITICTKRNHAFERERRVVWEDVKGRKGRDK